MNRGDSPFAIDQKSGGQRVDAAIKLGGLVVAHEDAVIHAEPGDEGLDRVPTFVVGPGGQLGDIVGRGIGLDAGNLAKVVHGVGAVGRAAADAEEEKSAVAPAQVAQQLDHAVDRLRIEADQDFGRFAQKIGGE